MHKLAGLALSVFFYSSIILLSLFSCSLPLLRHCTSVSPYMYFRPSGRKQQLHQVPVQTLSTIYCMQ